MDFIDSLLRQWRPFKKSRAQRVAVRLNRKRDLFLAFVIVSLPLLAIAISLLALVFDPTKRQDPDPPFGTRELPIFNNDTTNSYFTTAHIGSFLLAGSWASNIAELLVAPFMVIFSYVVARYILLQSKVDPKIANARPPLLRELIRGAKTGIWDWGAGKTSRSKSPHGQTPSSVHIIDAAAFGLLASSFLTVLVIVGDNWLHATTDSTTIRHYEPVTNYSQNCDPSNDNCSTNFYQAGFRVADRCNDMLTTTLPQNVSSADPPCSLNVTHGLTNVAQPTSVYLTLGTGISQINSSFNRIDFTSREEGEDAGTAAQYQVITYLQDDLSHSFLFYPDAAMEIDYTDSGLGPHWGYDFVANTTSMVTQCTFATEECDIRTIESTTNNISIPFHCYDDFSGDLGQTPATGHERAQGWNMSFYETVDGTPTNIPFQAQANPFHFYIATAVNSIDLQDFQDESNLTEGKSGNGSFIDAGRGFIAFALDCQATIYDVTFSLINGSFVEFNTTKSSPQRASIMQAPLQVGFGQYHLYQSASIAVLAYDDSVADTMGKMFSQTGVALASGAFDPDRNFYQRLRGDVHVTGVQKAPFFYLVIVCLVYSVFGMVMTAVAFYLRRSPKIKDQQAKLMDEWGPDIVDMEEEGAGEDRDRTRKERIERQNSSSSVGS